MSRPVVPTNDQPALPFSMTQHHMTPDLSALPADYPQQIEIDLSEAKHMDRLSTLQSDIAGGGMFQKDLKAIDLILLLQHDPWVQQLVGRIASRALVLPLRPTNEGTDSPDSAAQPRDQAGAARLPDDGPAHTPTNTPAPLSQPSRSAQTTSPYSRSFAPPPPPPEDTWRKELHEPLALLQCVRQDPELSALWLGAAGQGESEPRQLLRVCVMAAQWDQVTSLAEVLKTRCSQRQQAATANEMALLRGALALFNLSAGTLQAGLQTPAVGDNFDPIRHNRANSQGASIAECLLPAVLNRSKKVVQAALVLTR